MSELKTMKSLEFRMRLEQITAQIDALAVDYAAMQIDSAELRIDNAHGILDELDANRRGMTPFGRLRYMKETAPKEWSALAEALSSNQNGVSE